jgi:hypothetical protein
MLFSSASDINEDDSGEADLPIDECGDGTWYVAFALACAALVAYRIKLATSLTGGDSGELILAAKDYGLAHPPGYPLWTMLAHLFTLVPMHNIAWRVNLFSACCAAGAAGLLCRATEIFTGRWWAGVMAGGLFAFSPLTWDYAVQAEVFALNNFLVAALLWAAGCYYQLRTHRQLYLMAVLSGLALSNHHTSIFVVGPVLCGAIIRGRLWERKHSRQVGWTVVCLGAGLLPYFYLPLTAVTDTTGLVWGAPDTIQGFMDHILRREYGTLQLTSGLTVSKVPLRAMLSFYLKTAWPRLLFASLPLAATGLLWSVTGNKSGGRRIYALAMLVAAGLYMMLFPSLVSFTQTDPMLSGVLLRYFMLPDLLVAFLAGVGLFALAEWLPSLEILIAVLAVAAPFVQAGVQWSKVVKHRAVVSNYGHALLDNLPRNAILLVHGDLPVNAARYVQVADFDRLDVTLLDESLLARPWYVAQMRKANPNIKYPEPSYEPGIANEFSLAAFYEANASNHTVWVYPEPKSGSPGLEQLSFWPDGFGIQVMRSNSTPANLEDWDQECSARLKDLGGQFMPSWTNSAPGSWEHVVAEEYWAAVHRLALTWLRLALADPSDQNALDQARLHYESFLMRTPGPTWFAWKNLGVVYERQSRHDPSVAPLMVKAFKRYLLLAPQNDPDRKVIQAAVSRFEGAR